MKWYCAKHDFHTTDIKEYKEHLAQDMSVHNTEILTLFFNELNG